MKKTTGSSDGGSTGFKGKRLQNLSSSSSTKPQSPQSSKTKPSPTSIAKKSSSKPSKTTPSTSSTSKKANAKIVELPDEDELDDDEEDAPDAIDFDALPDAEDEEGDWEEGEGEGDEFGGFEDVDEDGDEMMEGDDDGEEDGDGEADEEGGEDGEDGEEETEGAPQKKAKTETAEEKRAGREEQKKLLKERKSNKPHASLIGQAKKIWETVRQKRIASDVRAGLMKEMMALITGHVQEVTFKHDAARMIQCCLKYGNQQQRDVIASELKGHYATLSKSQYGRFIVSKILNYCPKFRGDVIKEFYGQVRKLMRHKDASAVLEEAYSQFANATQRSALMEEFYGPEFRIFKSGGTKSLATLLSENPSKKPTILKYLRETLDSFLEKGTANIGPHTIIHRALLDYLQAADQPACADMVETLKDHLVSILHTREGARVAMLTIFHAAAKDRKHILKNFKGFVGKIAREQYGHAVLIAALDSIDDTVLSGKSILGEFLKPVAAATDVSEGVIGPAELLRDRWGSRVVLYLLAGRNTKYMEGYLIKELGEMDLVKKGTSKKEDLVRRRELLGQWGQAFLDVAVGCVEDLIRSKDGAQVLGELMRCQDGAADKTKLISAIAKMTSGTVESHAAEFSLTAHSKAAASSAGPFNAAKKLSADLKKEKVVAKAKADAKAKEAAVAKKNNKGYAKNGKVDDAEEDVEMDGEDGDDDDEDDEEEGMKMKKGVDVAEIEPDLSEHVLTHRAATFCLREMIGGVVIRGGDKSDQIKKREGGSPELAKAVAESVAPNLEYWLRRCAGDPRRTAGTAFVLLAIVEAGFGKELVGGGAGGLKKVLSEVEGVVKKSKSALEKEEVNGNGKKGGSEGNKRKRDDNGAGNGAGIGDGKSFVTGIETVIAKLRAL
ncbi:hypothetical protein HDU76_001533 [Blyttiomyces sp. JEL0837]|nr:hypothetical protein HDU76_001533 [Blyttiomyces sp. JEL0837]